VQKRVGPEPQPPVVTETTKAGTKASITLHNDPDYLAEHDRWEDEINTQTMILEPLFMFRDLEIPEGWDVEAEFGAEARFVDPDWKPHEGEVGRKYDYIDWVIMGDSRDAQLIWNTQAELAGIDTQEVAANEASFPDQVEEPTA